MHKCSHVVIREKRIFVFFCRSCCCLCLFERKRKKMKKIDCNKIKRKTTHETTSKKHKTVIVQDSL